MSTFSNHEQTAQLSDGKTAYHIHGERGPWVVLVHGLLTPMFAWQPLAEMLASEGYRVLRYDQFGRGLSDRPQLRYEPALYVRQLDELTRVLGIDAMHVVSWSMGGVIASRFAAQAPERVRSLTLIAPALFLNPPLKVRLLVGSALGRRLIARGLKRTVHALSEQHLVRPDLRASYRAGVLAQLETPGVGESFASTLQHFAWNDGPALTAVGQHARPVLIVWGDQDVTTPYANAARVQQLFPRASMLRVEGARHGVHLEYQDVVYPALCSCLQQAERSPHSPPL